MMVDKKLITKVYPNLKLYTLEEVIKRLGWKKKVETIMKEDEEVDCDVYYCCGKPVEVNGVLGCVDEGTCSICKKQTRNITAPIAINNSSMEFIDFNKVKLEGENRIWFIPSELNTKYPKKVKVRK
jgi:hypothetical protein